ncbi:MAG: Tex family protein [Rhodospirillaceae bacterium]
MISISRRIAEELGAREAQVDAAIQLLDEGSTVPFIARYRKEVTGGLDDTQLRNLAERLVYLRELEDRRATIVQSISDQGKMTDELARDIALAETKVRLEDLYLPYKVKRRTKALIAREAGLEPLAELLLGDPNRIPESEAAAYVNAEKGVADAKAALEGARHILVERFGEMAELVGRLRGYVGENGRVVSTVIAEKQVEGAKFSDYFDFSESLGKMPSHRVLALFRGRAAGVLDIRLEALTDPAQTPHPCEVIIAAHTGICDQGRPADKWLSDVVRWTWKLKIGPHLETDLMGELRERAENEAITVFARNLHDLLLAAPAGPKVVVGLDPGIRTGVKVAVVDRTGKLVDTATIYPHQPRNDWDGSLAVLAALSLRHQAELVSIGNGTASRETDRLVADLMKLHPQLNLVKTTVSEAGASVYSASEFAALEFPQLDVSLRGAVSIARRLQDPLAELVKIDPKSIGVGQYQHDVGAQKLAKSLDAVVEDCVNGVGVDLNTASVPLLSRVSGLNDTVARNIVEVRDRDGAFRSRAQLLEVPRLGPKTFEQAAGFLRICGGDNPLDGSSVHPEAYPVVERILKHSRRPLGSVIGDTAFLRALDPDDFTDDRFGRPTVVDIIAELEKPGRDPRPAFKTATFQDGVEVLKDLRPGMTLEGVVTNVTAFGAFVDVGVHQDGLVHISQLADKFVKDPHAVVKTGDVVRVKVLEVDLPRKRIALTMRMDEQATRAAADKSAGHAAADRSGPSAFSSSSSSPLRNASPGSTSPGRTGRTGGKGKPSAPPPPDLSQRKPAAKAVLQHDEGPNAFAEAFARAQEARTRK